MLKRHIKAIAPFSELSANTRYGNAFRIDLRNPTIGKKYVKIGNEGIIDARIIFEKDTGYVAIGDNCLINGTIISINGVEIGNDVIIAWDTLVYDHNSHSIYWNERKADTQNEYKNYLKYGDPCANKDWEVVRSAPIKICDKVWIGTGCKILKGVTIGEGAIVQAGSVVVADVEAWTIVGGNPATVIKRLEPEK
ncbi:acyltransferase [Butyrivibrio sp. AE3006]|uniref:acyltransferase n=1 Tax=Butyrivibrio sp. AE3006 TaxID=1280673 RepID=UPI0012DCBEE9